MMTAMVMLMALMIVLSALSSCAYDADYVEPNNKSVPCVDLGKMPAGGKLYQCRINGLKYLVAQNYDITLVE